MAQSKLRVVHYLNQFFGQIGGEEKANVPPEAREGVVGPGMGLKTALGAEAEIVGTVICGDSYFGENMAEATGKVLELIKGFEPDVVVAGPAFNAGRYGTACGAVCQAVVRELGIPAVTAMFPENPGVDMYKKDVYILPTADSAAGMRKALPKLAAFALRLGRGDSIGAPEEEGYIPRGVRRNLLAEKAGAARAVEMLVAKLRGEPFATELPMPRFDRVAPCPPVPDMAKATIALVTSGGIVPKGNPDHIESSSASKFGKYSLAGLDDFTAEAHQTAHGGYDPTYANADADRVLPLDVMRDLEREGRIGKLYDYWYSTVGNGTSVANAARYGAAIAQELKADGVTAVILTST
jgi:betaine reductase